MPSNLLLIVIFVLLFIFPLMQIRRQRKQIDTIKKFQQSLAPGMVVETAGGIQGRIEAVYDSSVALEISKGVVISLARNRIVAGLQDPTTGYDATDDVVDEERS